MESFKWNQNFTLITNIPWSLLIQDARGPGVPGCPAPRGLSTSSGGDKLPSRDELSEAGVDSGEVEVDEDVEGEVGGVIEDGMSCGSGGKP